MVSIQEQIARRRFGVSLLVPMLLVLLLWLFYAVGVSEHGGALYWLGIYPRTVGGLVGIVLSPLLHANLEHALSNSVSLLVLGVALFYFYPRQAWRVLLYGWLFTGILTWLIGRSSYHIGASGLIYLFGSYLFFRGWRVHRKRLAALSLVVTFAYGSLVWGVFPADTNISWEGHLSGALVGLSLALLQAVDTTQESMAFGTRSAYTYSKSVTHTGTSSWRLFYRNWRR